MRLRLRIPWFIALGIGLLFGASIVTALVIFHRDRSETALQLSQRLSQTAGTLIVAGLYLWREYIRHKPEMGSREAPAGGSAAAFAEVSSAPQIIQNIYPPSSSPPSLSDSRLRVSAAGTSREMIELRAERFVLIDREGRERAAMMVDSEGAATIRLLDRAGRRRVYLAVGADGFSELALIDAGGAARIELGTPGDDAYAYLAVRGQRTYLLAADGREVTESVWDEGGRRDWSAPIRPRRGQGQT